MKYAILTGQYPPQKGGVADYTRLLAHALSEAGDAVDVWAPLGSYNSGNEDNDNTFAVHRVSGHFNPIDLNTLDRSLRRDKPQRLLVQYVPHAFGFKGMNLPLCAWLMGSRRRYHIWVMFHEVVFPVSTGQSIKHNFLGMTTRLMASMVARAAEKIFVSTPSWNPIIRSLAPQAVQPHWLPVPSNIRRCLRACEFGSTQGRSVEQDQICIGHFGTYGLSISAILSNLLPRLLQASPKASIMLMGSGSKRFLDGFLGCNSGLENRIRATGFLSDHELSHRISACDIMFQPFPNGVTTRNTTLMAGLSHAKPVITTSGALTEDIWHQTKAVLMAPAHHLDTLTKMTALLCVDVPQRQKLSIAASSLYEEYFDMRRTIEILRNAA